MHVYEREIHIAKVVESSEECNKGGGTGNVARESIAAKQEKERRRQGGQVAQKKRNIEQIYVGSGEHV